MLTIEASSTIISCAIARTVRIHHRIGSGWVAPEAELWWFCSAGTVESDTAAPSLGQACFSSRGQATTDVPRGQVNILGEASDSFRRGAVPSLPREPVHHRTVNHRAVQTSP